MSVAGECRNKVRHPTESAVLTFKSAMKRKRKTRLYHYACVWCGGWHCSSKPRPAWVAMRRGRRVKR